MKGGGETLIESIKIEFIHLLILLIILIPFYLFIHFSEIPRLRWINYGDNSNNSNDGDKKSPKWRITEKPGSDAFVFFGGFDDGVRKR